MRIGLLVAILSNAVWARRISLVGKRVLELVVDFVVLSCRELVPEGPLVGVLIIVPDLVLDLCFRGDLRGQVPELRLAILVRNFTMEVEVFNLAQIRRYIVLRPSQNRRLLEVQIRLLIIGRLPVEIQVLAARVLVQLVLVDNDAARIAVHGPLELVYQLF